ncbi:MAG TPA: magnesium transporter [Egibacteraceae bacterium]|jgi:mgtE-like transporter|nr:magnesium transporter [Egibacteraceae bacterium]
MRFNPGLPREVFGYWTQERRTLRQGFTALAISSGVGMAAGTVLGFMDELLHALPGLFLLIPAAIGMRGAIFGALAARLGTGILTGQFTTQWDRRSFTGQNVEAAALLTLFSSALAALAARALAAAFGLPSIAVWRLMVISMVGGVLASAFIVVMVIALATTAQRRGWDMDAIGAPLVTTTGDIVTLPALVVATFLVADETFSAVLGAVLLAFAVGAVWTGLRSPGQITRRIMLESLPVLTYAAIVDILAGGVLEARVEAFVTNQALLVLIPPFIANCGSLGGILSARLGSELHLGLISPRRWPEKIAAFEGSITVLFSVAAFAGVGLIAHTVSIVFGFDSPGLATMVGVALTGGLLAFVFLFAVAYYAATATFRFGLDPDNHGIPIVTATMDFLGVLCLVAAIALFGVG